MNPKYDYQTKLYCMKRSLDYCCWHLIYLLRYQNETFRLTNPELIKCDLIRVTPPIRTLSNADAPMGPNYRTVKGVNKEDEDEDGQIRLHRVKNPNALPKGISPAVQMNYDFANIVRTPATLNLRFRFGDLPV